MTRQIMRCQVCGIREATRRYADLDICGVDYNLALRLVERMRTVVKDEDEEIVTDPSPHSVIREVVKRRLHLDISRKWSGNRKATPTGSIINRKSTAGGDE